MQSGEVRKMHIRPVADNHYPEMVSIWNDAYPELARTSDEFCAWDEWIISKLQGLRLVAEIDGRVVGLANYRNDPMIGDPHLFFLQIVVDEEYRNCGIGNALFQALMSSLDEVDAHVVNVWVRKDRTLAIRSLRRKGFEQHQRVHFSELAVQAFDVKPYAGKKEKLGANGIRIKTYRELEKDPDRDRKLYELESELVQDVVAPYPAAACSFEDFTENLRENPKIIPEAYFVAVHGDEYVGQTVLLANKAIPSLETSITGVRRKYRNRGIALVLKLQAIKYAGSKGYPNITTANDSRNLPILAINDRLGFRHKTTAILFSKRISGDTVNHTI
jgi:GNAT superfamily N-acetyltransferase